MALELTANDAQTTTTGAINNSSDPVTFTVTSAAAFPATGNFTIKIDNEYLLVTTVSGADFTASRAQEGSSIASHSGGATVTLVQTAGSFKRIIGEFHGSGTYANRPAAGTAGRLYLATDNPGVMYRDTGSAWQMYGSVIGPFTAPDITTFGTWVNQQNATIAQLGDMIRMEDDGTNNSGEDMRLRVKTLTGTVSSRTELGMRFYSTSRWNAYAGIVHRKTSDGKIIFHGPLARNDGLNKAFVARWDTFNAFAGAHVEGNYQFPDLIFLRVDWATPNNFKFYMSHDGTKWWKYSDTTDANLASFDQIGIAIGNTGPSFTDGSAPIGMDIFYLSHSEV